MTVPSSPRTPQTLRELLAKATPGPWWWDEDDDCMRLHGVAAPGSLAKRQILKAPKRGTPYAEYWPGPADADLIVAMHEALPGILDENADLKRALHRALPIIVELCQIENRQEDQEVLDEIRALLAAPEKEPPA